MGYYHFDMPRTMRGEPPTKAHDDTVRPRVDGMVKPQYRTRKSKKTYPHVVHITRKRGKFRF